MESCTATSTSSNKAAWTTRDPIDQFATIVRDSQNDVDVWYIADVYGPKLSESGRLALVQRCVKSQKPVVWAMCQGDIDALDWTKLDGEIAGNKDVKAAADEVRGKLKAHADDVAKVQAKDPAWKKVFELAAAERKDWDERWRDKAALLDLVTKLDEAVVTGSAHGTDGCKATTWDALAKEIQNIPAKAFTTHRNKTGQVGDVIFARAVQDTVINTILNDPNAYLAASAYATCYRLEEGRTAREADRDALAAYLQPRLRRWVGFRGPRTGIQARVTLASLKFDGGAKLDTPQLARDWWDQNGMGGGDVATVATVKVNGDKSTVSFAQKPVKSFVDTGCSQGNFHGWRSDGAPEYELNCTGTETVMIDHSPKPMEMATRYAKPLKGGQMIVFGNAVPLVAYAKPDAHEPVLVLGQPVK